MPLLSIIIPSYNNLELLKDCIESIKIQSFTDYEVIIVDGNSTDRTIEYLQSLTEPFHWISESDQGIYDAMNKGIEMASGEWLLFMGCDDLLYKTKTLEAVFSSEIINDMSLIIGKVQYAFNSKDSLLIHKNKGLFEPSWSWRMWLKNTLHHQGVFYKRELFRKQKFKLEYKVLSDYDFNLNLFISKAKVCVVNQIVTISRTQGISKNYDWELYKEEIKLKTKLSSIKFKPLFYLLCLGKFVLKKIV